MLASLYVFNIHIEEETWNVLGTGEPLIISHHITILLWPIFQLVFIEGMKIYQIVYCSLWESY